MLEWLVPATARTRPATASRSPCSAPTRSSSCGSGRRCSQLRRVARLPQSWADATLPCPVAVLQWLLVAAALLGGIPLLTFDLAPDASAVAVSGLTSSVVPLVVIGASIAQHVALGRTRGGTPSTHSATAHAILGHQRSARTTAAVVAVACGLAGAAFLVEELPRLGTGHAGDYGVFPFLLLVAVTAAGLPYSWIVAAIAFSILIAHPMAGLGPAPAALDAAASIAMTVPALLNAIRAARMALSRKALPRWVHRHLERAQVGRQ